jgi:5-methyltetrahydropteroyltriglutamate--homocysteine methyltransferase
VDYAMLLPELLQMEFGNFYVQLASEKDPERVLQIIKKSLRPGQKIFVGVTDPIDPSVETPEEIRGRILKAAEYIPLDQLGSTDDCGFAPFSDDVSTPRQTAFDKIRSRIAGNELAADELRI